MVMSLSWINIVEPRWMRDRESRDAISVSGEWSVPAIDRLDRNLVLIGGRGQSVAVWILYPPQAQLWNHRPGHL